ncbi:MAG TPA: hypothetical protein PK696_00185 [bacterium]|nr:hypothetical protein [Chlamydiota bacterium]HOE26099.1 hypothetical protein [bacterium]HQM52526.1 hypothetical protein [bacterium]
MREQLSKLHRAEFDSHSSNPLKNDRSIRIYANPLPADGTHPKGGIARGWFDEAEDQASTITGHLYGGRFKAVVVEADEYLKELSRYLHLNPVRLKKYKELPIEEKAKLLKEYRWSSLRGYMGLGKRDSFVLYDTVLGYMGGETKEGARRYGDFVLSGLGTVMKNPLADSRAGAVLGTESFIEWIRKTFVDGRKWTRKEQPQVKPLRGVIPVEEIAQAVGEEYGVKPAENFKVRSPHREARRVLLEMSYRLNTNYLPLQKLGDELGGIGGAAITNNHMRLQQQMSDDARLTRRVEKIHRKLFSV